MFSMIKKLQREEREPSLVDRHFVMQEERPPGIGAVEIEVLDPFLRNLLFTDGTVTRALGVHVLAPVSVDRVGQSQAALSPLDAETLEASLAEEAIRRRVQIGIGEPAVPVLWAESFMLPERLPPGFLGLLEGAPDGIGQSLRRVSLESRRELCWYGLEALPEWAGGGKDAAGAALRRQYRIVCEGEPAILISEYFLVEQRLGVYHLAGLRAHQARAEERGRFA